MINKITNTAYKNNILKSLGIQFLNLLISHYGKITYSKEGLGALFFDIANYKKVVVQIGFD
jgi:hypothetical protein